ncbi:DUF6783 domain-containing protein [Blautia sp. HCP3S3_H10_1]|uniref:DUF6783 domain-containing protein n=1 Tax=unclassified Blautia TaxID=2648079 RepID=UPI003F8F5FA5
MIPCYNFICDKICTIIYSPRAWKKNHSRNQTKSPTNFDAHLAENLFQTRSRK